MKVTVCVLSGKGKVREVLERFDIKPDVYESLSFGSLIQRDTNGMYYKPIAMYSGAKRGEYIVDVVEAPKPPMLVQELGRDVENIYTIFQNGKCVTYHIQADAGEVCGAIKDYEDSSHRKFMSVFAWLEGEYGERIAVADDDHGKGYVLSVGEGIHNG